MISWDLAKRSVDTLATQIWRMTPTNATKAENLENDSEDLLSKHKGVRMVR